MARWSSRPLAAAALLAAHAAVAAGALAKPTGVALAGGMAELAATFSCPDSWWSSVDEVTFDLKRTDVTPAVVVWASVAANHADDALPNQRGKSEEGEIARDSGTQKCSFTITSASIDAAKTGHGQGRFTLQMVSSAIRGRQAVRGEGGYWCSLSHP